MDIGLTVLAWFPVLHRSHLIDYPVVLTLAPNIGLAIGAIAVRGLGWGLLRMALTVRVAYLTQS